VSKNSNSNEESLADGAQVRSLLNAVYARYGLDFRNYADASIRRRIEKAMRSENLATILQLERRLLADPACMERFLVAATVNVTSMFRDPDFYGALRREVVPQLRQRHFLRIWHAGCSTGEEVFSLAILLREEGVGEQCRIYATDLNADVLERARQGVFPLPSLREYSRNYIAAGGSRAFSDYYRAQYDHVLFDRTLTSNIVFSQHNLVSDGPFNRFDLILCRNVLIYFNQCLADHVHRLLFESLAPAGYLCLGNSEMIRFTPYESSYHALHAEQRIYQRRP
jgi:chemotaxis protein methyltransferase CheR